MLYDYVKFPWINVDTDRREYKMSYLQKALIFIPNRITHHAYSIL